jgi:ABC-type amino acid transport substrate-binding protein
MMFRHILISTTVAFIVSWLSFTIWFDRSVAAHLTQKKQESVYDRVMRTKTIRCGYFLRPLLVDRDVNSKKLSGTLYDIVEEIGKMLSLKIIWAEEINPADYVAGLENDRYDAVCSGWVSSQRARVIDYTRPVLYERIGLFTRANDTRFDKDPSLLNDPAYTMGVIDGNVPFYITLQRFPQAKKSSIPENTPFIQILLDVAGRKADAAVYSRTEAFLYMQKNPDKIKMIPGNEDIAIYPSALGIKRNQTEFRRMLDNTLLELEARGVIDTIIAKHAPEPGIILPPARGYQGIN